MAEVPAGGMPVPMGVRAESGETRPALSVEELSRIAGGAAAAPPEDAEAVLARAQARKVLGVAGNVDDPMDLAETGWAVAFASGIDARIREALQPLLDLRRKQVRDSQNPKAPKLFRVFEGAEGVFPGQPAANWARQRGVSLTAAVDPRKGAPYYLLLVGSPEQISFEFQALLDLQWAVGRLYFDEIEDYARYARAVVEYEEPGFRPAQAKNIAAWVTKHDGDAATVLLASAVAGDFLNEDDRLGYSRNFSLDWFGEASANGEAGKKQLGEIVRGNCPSGVPAILFTGSHGAEWPRTDPGTQRLMQGALVTQEWSRGKPLDAENVFTAADLPEDARVHGMMAFLFACYSGGCPAEDSYYFHRDGSKIPVAPAPLIAKLPQALLARGALAVIAHVDRAFSFTVRNLEGTPQTQTIRTPLELLMKGKRVGLAADSLNLQWSSLAAELGAALGRRADPDFDPESFASLYIARDDARNYVVLGDPAVYLRVKEME
jgi:hypothetical protein